MNDTGMKNAIKYSIFIVIGIFCGATLTKACNTEIKGKFRKDAGTIIQ